ncbi:MAG: Glu-tRNA(Gln) amidotransferase subunit GatD [Nanoarchaeota archaeon]|nr:Glu-tRNA(Gln) amidotransferase subunit GatD [Nanoarchaeota archaeon]
MAKTIAIPGDRVEVHLSKVIYGGILLESPEDEKGIVLLKLDSGYNIGLNKKDIIEIKRIKKGEIKKERIEIKKDDKKPDIALILTGGTIVNRLDPKTGAVSPLTSPEDLFKSYPKIFDKVNVIKVEMPFMKASEDMDYKDWQNIAKICERLLNDKDVKGVVITHGTDILHYTSAVLSFFLRNLTKPVVLTYSQRSSDRASSDANLNLICSALAAVSDIAEVMLVGHANSNDEFCYAIPGTKTRKLHTSRRDAFKPVNAKPFAKIFPNKIEILSEHNVRKSGKVKADTKFEEKVALIKFYPGQDPDILDYYLKKGYKGIVVEALGLGHVAVNSRLSWIKKLKEVQKKMIVCFAAQTIYGRLDPYVYSNLREIMKTGVIYLEDMLAETAFVKLGWVLGHTTDKEKVKEMMLTNYARELNDRLEQ